MKGKREGGLLDQYKYSVEIEERLERDVRKDKKREEMEIKTGSQSWISQNFEV